ncbi:MAG: ABC transporter permease [Bacteroidota bacterium]
MIQSFFKIAWRNLSRNKGFTFINILGLSIGVAACILIFVYINHESTYDSQVPNAENVYRLTNNFTMEGQVLYGVHFSANTAPTLLADFPEVTNSGRLMDNGLFYGAGSNEIQFGDNPMQFHEEGFSYADQSMVDIMGIEMVYGEAKTALASPKSIVISEKISRKHFQQKNPIGSSIFLNGNKEDPFTISGVMKDFPSNSHLDYDFLITLTDVEVGPGEQTRWLQNNYFTYVVLKEGTDYEAFSDKMATHIIRTYLKPAMKDGGFAMYETIEDSSGMGLQPLQSINLHSGQISFEASFRNDIKIIWIFGIVALFILVIASINFVNLSTAKSINRAKEVGMRKVIGAIRPHLIGQFLMESVIISLFAFLVGSLLSILLLPYFRQMSGIELVIPWSQPLFVPALLLISIMVGILAGLYPAFYLSKFNPVHVLKGRLHSYGKSGGLRSSLVVLQFAISIILIVSTLIVNQQMNFILNSKIGFEKEQVVQIYGSNMLGDQAATFKKELEQLPGISSVSISDYLPIEGTKRNGNSFVNEGRDNIDPTVPGQAWIIDEDYLQTMGMKLKAGRNFSEEMQTDDDAVIINEEMASRLFLEEPLGKRISRYGRLYEIIGVVEDFNFNTLEEKVQPLCFFRGISNSIISVKVQSEEMNGIIKNMDAKWAKFVPNLAFRYEFMNRSFANMYEGVKQIQSIFTSFAILAIFVACLGLFALSAYMVEQRNKEMSIRKVLGASVENIFQLLTKNFLALIVVSLILAIPLSYYLMTNWLQDYEYKIDINWSVFAIAGVIALAIALLTVSFHAAKSALVNPVEHLRGE